MSEPEIMGAVVGVVAVLFIGFGLPAMTRAGIKSAWDPYDSEWFQGFPFFEALFFPLAFTAIFLFGSILLINAKPAVVDRTDNVVAFWTFFSALAIMWAQIIGTFVWFNKSKDSNEGYGKE